MKMFTQKLLLFLIPFSFPFGKAHNILKYIFITKKFSQKAISCKF